MKLRVVLFVTLLFLLLPVFVSAKDVWTSVSSRNFHLIGDAAESEIKQVALKLEQFRDIFRQIFPKAKLDSRIPTRILVFKNRDSYKPFKPIRADGEIDDLITGHFQAGEDVNYIAFSGVNDLAGTDSTLFHEYTHFVINNTYGRTNIPLWLEEGFAAYYQTLRMENNGKAIVGKLSPVYLQILQEEPLIPFETFLSIDNQSLHMQADSRTRNIFYVQSSALLHYLQQGDKNRHRNGLTKFFELLSQNNAPRDAFQQAFQIDHAELEKEFKNYIAQRSFDEAVFTITPKSVLDADFQSAPLNEAETNSYLGDFLLHTNRLDQAAVYLEKALRLDNKLAPAHASLGMTRARQRRFFEAKKHLEKAIELNSSNYLLHYYYAYALSQENADETGYVNGYVPEMAEKIRETLDKAIELNPDFPESYHLLAFVNLVRNENLDEAISAIGKASALEPGNQWYALKLAQIRLRRAEYEETRKIAQRIFASTADKDLRRKAQAMVISVNSIIEQLKRINQIKERPGEKAIELPVISQEEGLIQALNEALRKPLASEKRLLGYLTQVDCGAKGNVLAVRPASNSPDDRGTEKLKFNAGELQKIRMITFAAGIEGKQIGCGATKPEILAVVTFRPGSINAQTTGEIVSLEFVPKIFRFVP